jgi:hypothetical protein
MKRLLFLSVILAVAGLCITAAAQEVEKTVILLRSMDDPNIPPDWSRCTSDITGFDTNVVLGASLWSSNTRANDGQVVKEKVNQIGTANACFQIGSLTAPPFTVESPFYIEINVGDLDITAEGECEATISAIMQGGPIFAGCYGRVIPELSTDGIKWGQVTSNSILTPFPIPGFETGSFWAIQLIWE